MEREIYVHFSLTLLILSVWSLKNCSFPSLVLLGEPECPGSYHEVHDKSTVEQQVAKIPLIGYYQRILTHLFA